MDNLPKVVKDKTKRLGRGYGSGKGGHTVGRGQKGQKARRTIPILFEGMKVKKSLLRRLPLSRGKGKFKTRGKPLVIKTNHLNLLPDNSVVTIELLAKAGIVKMDEATKCGVKILSNGKVVKKLTISVPTSKSAAHLIEEAGGKIN